MSSEREIKALETLLASPFVYVWRDDEGFLGHRGWWEVRLTPADERRFYAYEPTFAEAVERAAELAKDEDDKS